MLRKIAIALFLPTCACAVPNSFTAATTASASQVNENFQFVEQGKGDLSSIFTPSGYTPGDLTHSGSSVAEHLKGLDNFLSATPGGELGGTWASPTLDDGITVSGWTLGSPTIAGVGAPAPTANGQFVWDNDDFRLLAGNGSSSVVFIPASGISGGISMTSAGVVTTLTGDSATSFFAAGQLELARGGTGGDASAFGTGLLGLSSGTLTDVDTFGEWVTAVGITGTCNSTSVVFGDGTCAVPSAAASALDTAGVDLRYDSTLQCFYPDFNGNSTHDAGVTEQCLDGTIGDGTSAPFDGRRAYCDPISYEFNGTTTTSGIQECVDYLGTIGGGEVRLSGRGYFITTEIVIDEDQEIMIRGAGRLASSIQCLSASGCTATRVLHVLDNGVTLRDFGIVINTAARDAGIEVGSAADYASNVVIEDVSIDGNSAEVAGSRVGAGIRMRSLENRVYGGEIRWFSDGVRLEATTTGGVNAVHLGVDVRSTDTCVDTNVGGDIANEGDAFNVVITDSKCQDINGSAIVLRGGSANPTNYNSLHLSDSHIENAAAGVDVIGAAGSYDPNVYVENTTFAETVTAVTADANSNTTIIVSASGLDSNDCITHNGTGYVYTHSLYSSGSPCTPTVNGSTSFWRSFDSDVAWIDEAFTLTADAKGLTASANDSDTSLATTAFTQQEINGAGGRSVTCSSGSCDADAELYTVSYSFPWLASSVVATNDIVVHEVESTFTPTRWACVADGGSGLTTIDASIEECNSNGASCTGIGATSTVTATNTTVADTAFTDTTLTAGNWLKFTFGTITWTSPGTFSCTLRGTRND